MEQLKKKIEQIENEEFLKESCENEFIDKIFGDESKLGRKEFQEKLKSGQFNWMFDMATVRQKVDVMIENYYGIGD